MLLSLMGLYQISGGTTLGGTPYPFLEESQELIICPMNFMFTVYPEK